MENLGTRPGRNGGELNNGNPPPPGGWPGAGRPKDEVRAIFQGNAEVAAHKLKERLESEPDMATDILIRIQDSSAKYSIGTKNEVTLNNAQLVDVIFRAFGDEFDRLELFTDEEARKELFERVALVADGVK